MLSFSAVDRPEGRSSQRSTAEKGFDLNILQIRTPLKKAFNASVGHVHSRFVFQHRTKVLAEEIAQLVAGSSSLLDVGTGDGRIARQIGEQEKGTLIEGIDVLVRSNTHIPAKKFDGQRIPHDDDSFDAVTFVDVLHHTDTPGELLREAARVSKKIVVIKDHLAESRLDNATLRFMDWVGNAPHGVALPYNYASGAQWKAWFKEAGLTPETYKTDIPLYPWPFSAVFGRSLHFVARLRVRGGK